MNLPPSPDSLPPQTPSITPNSRALPNLLRISQTTRLPNREGPPVPPKTAIPPPIPPKTILQVPVGGHQEHQQSSEPNSLPKPAGPVTSRYHNQSRPISTTDDGSILQDRQRASSNASVAYATFCEECNITARNIVYCNVCEMSFCWPCWDQQTVHKRKRLGPGGVPHEKTKPGVAKKVRNALAPPTDEKMRERLCKEDEVTSWFGS